MSRVTDLAKWYQGYKKQEQEEGRSPSAYTDVRDKYHASVIERAYKEGRLGEEFESVQNRIKKFGDTYNTYLNDYFTRYGIDPQAPESEVNAGADEYYYRGDTQDYLDKVTGYRDGMAGESEAIKRIFALYKPYVNEEYYNDIVKMLDGYGSGLDAMVDYASKDHEYFSGWENEDEYKDSWYYHKFNEKYAGIDTADKWQEAYDEHVANVKAFRDDKLSNTGILADNSIELPEELVREGEYIQSRIDYYKVKNYDGAAAEAEIAYLQEAVDVLGKYQISPQDAGRRIQLPANYGEIVAEIQKKYGMTYAQAKDRLAEATYTHNQMVSAQENLNRSEHYDSFKQNSDFAEYSKYDSSLFGDRTIDWGTTIGKNGLELVFGALEGGTGIISPSGLEYNYDGLEYGFVNGDPQATQWYIEEYYEDNSAIGELIRGETEGYNLYTFLREDEKEMYNYLYKSQGEAAAHEYLEFLASDLESRKADERAKWFEDKPIAGTLYSIPAGIDQFASGVEGIFKDEYDPSVTSMTGQKIREDLADDGRILWYDFSAGSWREMKVLGSSGAQMVYDALSSGANMLPSILVSLAVEAALPTVGEGTAVFAGLTGAQIAAGAGAVTMGASAMGNAKQEMLGMGYSVDQANAYGLMVGASEAGLSYLLSGIPGLRGGDGVFSALGEKAISKVDNALARAAITLGGDMLDEGLEEGLQTVLEGWFKEIATGVDFEDPSADEVLYSSLLGALTAAGFGGGKLAIDTGVNTINTAINTSKVGNSFIKQNGQSGVGALAAQGLELNQNTAAYKQAGKVQAKLDSGKNASRYSVGKLYSSMSESQTSTAVQSRLSAHIENKTEVRKLSNTITDILYGREVSDKALSSVAANKYALNALNDVLGSKLNKSATVSEVRAAVQSYQEAGKSESGANASTNTKRGSTGKISGQSGAAFSVSENADGKFDVVAEADGESRALMSFKSQKQAQAVAYAMTLGMGAEGLRGLAALAENLPNGVDLGEAALAFNAIYNQGKSGKALSAAKNANLLSPEQRQYAYNLGIMDKALDGVRKKSSGEVLQKNAESDKIIEETQEDIENEREGNVRLREDVKRNDGKNTGGQVSAVESRTGEAEEQGSGSAQEKRSASIRAFVEAEGLSKVSSKSKGIDTGTDTENIVVIPESEYDEGMQKIVEEQAAQGRKVIFVSGAMELVENGELIEARGVISADGKTMWIQADDATVAPEQIALHEEFHAKVKADPSLIGRMKAKVKEKYKGKLELLTEVYANLYFTDDNGNRTVSDDYIIEEILADAYAGIDVLGVVADADVRATEFSEDIREGAKNIESTRAPPSNGEVKASRSNKDLYTATDDFYREVAKDDRSAFISRLSSKTKGIKQGETRIVVLYTGQNIYIFVADGYMTGKIGKVLSTQTADINQIIEARKDILNEIDTDTEIASLWVEAISNNGRGSGSNISLNAQGRSDNAANDRISGISSRSNGGRNNRQSRQIDHSPQEIDAILQPLKEMYGFDGADIKASRSLKSPEDVAQAYIKAVPNRLILANALESQADNAKAKELLAKYKNKIADIEADQGTLDKTKAELHDLYFAKGKRNVERIKTLEARKEKLEARIDNADRWLLRYEETKPIKDIIARERERAYKKAIDEGNIKRKKATEGRHKTAMRHKIAGVVSELDKLLRRGTKERNVKIGLQDAVAAALEIFDLNSEKVERYNKAIADLDARIAAATDPVEIEALTALREKKVRNSERLADKLQVMKKAYEDIHNGRDGENYPSYYKAECEAIENRIADVMEKVGDTPIGEMSLEQLEAVYDMYRMVLTTVRNANKVFKDGKLADLTADAADMTSELQRIKKLAEERLKAGDDIRGFVWNELTPYYAFNRIGSDTLMSYYNELIRGQDVYARDIEEAQSFAEETRKKHGYGKWKLDKVHSFTDADGRDFRLTLRHMMSIYAYSKREQAFDHMEKGGFFFNNKETFRKKAGVLEFIASNESGYKVDARIFAKIKGALTADQIAYVDEMQAYLTEMGEKGNEVTRQMWGIDLFKEKAYFPLKSKEDFIYQANTPAETSSLKNDGMTKETKPHASNPIVLESFDDVWANHVEKMSKYHGFVVPIDNLNKLVNYGTWADGDAQSISTTLEARYGGVNEYITTFIKDLNGAKAQRGGVVGGAFDLLTKFKKTSVAASLSVVVQQPTAILRATSEIDPKYFVHLSKPEGLNRRWNQIKKYAPIAIIKDIGGFDSGSGKQITEWMNADTQRGTKKVLNKIDDLTMYGAALGDRIGWGAIWQAVIREVQAKQGLTYGTEEFWQACGKRFTDVIVKTQVYDSTLSRSGFMRGKDGLMKMATAFMGEPTLSINMLTDTLLQAKRGKISKGQVVRTFASVYTATVAASIIKSFIYALRDDDEDESYAEKYMQALGGSILDDINPLSMLPVLRDVVSIFQGWDVERTDMAVVQDLYNAINSLGSEKKTTYRKIEDLAGAVAALVGVPVKNVMRTAREIYNAIDDIFDGIDGGDLGGAFLEGITGEEKGKTQTLYEALIDGDPDRIYAIKKTYKTEESYLTAVRKDLRTYDPRIKEAAQAQIDGDISRRNALLRKIVGEGIFDEMMVSKAIAAEVNSIKGEESSSAEPEDDTPWYDRKKK